MKNLSSTFKNPGAQFTFQGVQTSLVLVAAIISLTAVCPVWASPSVGPSADLTVYGFHALKGAANVVKVVPENDTSVVGSDGMGNLLFDFNTSGGWAGAGFSSDNYGTPGVEEVWDLRNERGLAFRVKGSVRQVKCDVVDSSNRKYTTFLTGINSVSENVWEIPVSSFQSVLDISRLRYVYFVVEGGGLSGRLEVRANPATEPPLGVSSLTLSDIQAFPVRPRMIKFAPENDSSVITTTERGMSLGYRTVGGWVTGTMNFDPFDTAALESVNLSAMPNIVLGIQGSAQEVEGPVGDLGTVLMEVEDVQGRKYVRDLTGIVKSEEKVWSIPTAEMKKVVDLGAVRFLSMVVRANYDKRGTLVVNDLSTSGSSSVVTNPSVPADAVVTPDGLHTLWLYNQRGNIILMAMETRTQRLVQHMANMGVRIVAYSNDIAVIASSVNTFYIAGLNDPTLDATVFLPAPSGPTAASLAQARFLTPPMIELKTVNGDSYIFNSITHALRPMSPSGSKTEVDARIEPTPGVSPSKVFFYPNPVRNGGSTLRVEGTGNGSLKLSIYNARGDRVVERSLELMSSLTKDGWTGDIPIRMDELRSGLYLYVVESQGATHWRTQGKLVVLK